MAIAVTKHKSGWDYLLWIDVDKYNKKRNRTNLGQLYATIEKDWRGMFAEFCRKLIESLPGRCAEVIRVKINKKNKNKSGL